MKRPHPAFRLLGLVLGPAAAGLSAGCLVYQAVTTPVNLAATTVVAAGRTAGAVVSTTGKVASAAVSSSGSVAADTLEGAAKLAHAGMVTFVDASTGTVVRVPWQEGMTLAGAADAAKVRTAQQSLAILRSGLVVYAATKNPDVTVPVSAGDVVRLTK
ncbi:MAG TPA: hypothetical protein VG838_15165 [Opitutaceae bacterium]|nr:hypothetical protein [Opitutaceae bacterium]